jgi:(2Fe-2S) ferredoxin
MRFTHHVFICENKRPDGDPRGCCCGAGAEAVRSAFKEELHRRGLRGQVRANGAGCLDACSHAPAVVVYPEGVWYGHVTAADVPEIVERHLIGGQPVERLRLHDLEDARKVEPHAAGAGSLPVRS